MPNGKTPEDTGEHLMALYGHVEGLKKDVNHLHRDIEKLNDKVEGIDQGQHEQAVACNTTAD